MSEPFVRVLSSGNRVYVQMRLEPYTPTEGDRETIRSLVREFIASATYREELAGHWWIDLGGES